MAWIESHQSLLTHRKLTRAAGLLKVNKFQLIGHLHSLWWWGLDNAANDGDLGEAFPEEIADAAGWPTKRAKEFLDALVFVHFIDEKDNGHFQLHNWWKYAGKLNDKKEKDRVRKTSGGSVEFQRNSDGSSVEVARKSQAPTHPPTTPTNQQVLAPEDGSSLTTLPTPSGAAIKSSLKFTEEEVLSVKARLPGYDFNALWREWSDWIIDTGKGLPDNKVEAFIGFAKRKTPVVASR